MSEEKSCCPQDTWCEGKCFDDERYIENCIQSSCCEGYCNDIECMSWARKCLDNFCDSSNPCERCCGCCMFCYCNLPLFCTIVATFWMMVFFFLFFMPPLIVVLLQTRMLRPKKFHTFDWLEKEEIRADTKEDGHVEAPCSCINRGWFRCFVICNVLCALGWFPGVIFASGLILFYFIQLCKEGWD